jgi:phage/plasmid-like protein (TIGR03299 family)
MAGLDWDIRKDEILTLADLRAALQGRGTLTPVQVLAVAGEHAIDGWRAITRVDTNDKLAVVTDEYVETQNAEHFGFLEALLGETIPETAFSLWGGRQIGALTRLPESITVGGDEVRQYLYLRSRHDGTGATRLFPTDVRVVCANTDRAALDAAGGLDGPGVHKILHRGDKSSGIHQARQALQLTLDASQQFKQLGDRLAREAVSHRQLSNVLEQLYPSGIGIEGGPTTARQQRTRRASQESVRQIFLTGDTQGNAPGSKWCLYNAAIEHNQHHRSIRTKDERLAGERRFVRAFEDPEGFGRVVLAAVETA